MKRLWRRQKPHFKTKDEITLKYLKYRACERFKNFFLFENLDYQDEIDLLAFEKIRIKEEIEIMKARLF